MSACRALRTFPTLESDTVTFTSCFRLNFELYLLLAKQLPKTLLRKDTTSSKEGKCKLVSKL